MEAARLTPPQRPGLNRRIIDESSLLRLFLKSLKDNFHNIIFGIDKMGAPGIFRSTTLVKLPLSEGGDGWRKDLRNVTVAVG